jgi:dihydrofolate reductase
MKKLILIAHISLDGFAAGEQGEFDGFNPSPESLEFVCDLTDKADALLVGRVSYQMLETAWPTMWSKPNATPSEIKYSNWYNAAEKIVLSNTLTKGNSPNTKIINGNILSEITKIKQQGNKNILLFGSPATFRKLNELKLIDEYWILLYPTLFGKGIPLFLTGEPMKKLKLTNSIKLTNGEMAINYKVQ